MPGWTDVSSLRNWVLGDPILDWLNEFGEAAGFTKDTEDPFYTPQADLGLFVRAKGKQFEARVIELIKERFEVATVKAAPSNEDDFYEQTLRFIREGKEAIYQGLVRDPELEVFGVPDLIMRGSAISALVCNPLPDIDLDGYYIVDIKYKGLSLNKNGSLSSSHRWEKVQLSLYEKGLAAMVGRQPGKAFMLGGALAGKDGAGGGCFDNLGWVDASDPKIWVTVADGLNWLLDLEANGSEWKPGDPRLKLGDNSQDAPWHNAKKEIAEGLRPPPPPGPDVSPAHITANRAEWIENPGLEFYVDFETVNSMNDDFKSLPLAGGVPMIFMIGCGHEEDGEWLFRVWTAQQETYEEEARIVREWLAYMEAVRQRLAPSLNPKVFHWHSHEVQELAKAAERHRAPNSSNVNWYDLLARVMKAEPVEIRGINSRSLKPVTRALHEMGHIGTVWDESPVGDGVAAMAAAWWTYEQGRATNRFASEVHVIGGDFLMAKIEEYNEVDCKAMWEILTYLRRNH